MRIFSHPIKKLTLLSVLAGGYILGAKAGRERYEQIVEAADKVKANPRVDDVISRAESIVRDATGRADSGGDASSTVRPAPADRQDQVVYSSGPDIEETVDELRAHDESERI
jgi:hypothetical protein